MPFLRFLSREFLRGVMGKGSQKGRGVSEIELFSAAAVVYAIKRKLLDLLARVGDPDRVNYQPAFVV